MRHSEMVNSCDGKEQPMEYNSSALPTFLLAMWCESSSHHLLTHCWGCKQSLDNQINRTFCSKSSSFSSDLPFVQGTQSGPDSSVWILILLLEKITQKSNSFYWYFLSQSREGTSKCWWMLVESCERTLRIARLYSCQFHKNTKLPDFGVESKWILSMFKIKPAFSLQYLIIFLI